MTNKWKSLPKDLIERLHGLYGESKYGQIMKAFCEKKPTTFRANTLKIDAESLREKLDNLGINTKRVNWNKDAFIYEGNLRTLTDLDLYKNGVFYVQSLSSMIPPMILAPNPGEKILDITAAPGSKTTQMAAMMKNKGEIVANDISQIRLYKLEANVRIQGVDIVRKTNKDARSVWKDFPEYFDKTLVDVPCSLEGKIYCYEPKTYKNWSVRNIKDLSKRSKWILRSAISATKVGGRIVYSTCTLSPEENEGVIQWILEKEKGKIELEYFRIPGLITDPPIAKWEDTSFSKEITRTARILPSATMEGFYIAVLRKTKSTVNPDWN